MASGNNSRFGVFFFNFSCPYTEGKIFADAFNASCLMVELSDQLGCVYDLGEQKGQTRGDQRKLAFEQAVTMRQIGGGLTLQLEQQKTLPQDIAWAGDYSGVFTKHSARTIQSRIGNRPIHPDLGVAIKLVQRTLSDADKAQHPWKQLLGSVHEVQPGVSWFILCQESLVTAGALGASADGWHIDDLSKLISTVIDSDFLATGQGDAHIWTFGAPHPDGSSLIMFGFYVTLEPNQWTLCHAWLWLKQNYARVTRKGLFVRR